MFKKNSSILEDLKNNFPFLTFGIFNNEEYLGITQNIKNNFIYIYLFNLIKNKELKQNFLLLGSKWWWESDRKIPVNIFFKDDFIIYKDFLRIFSLKKFKLIYLPNENNFFKTKKNVKKLTIIINKK